MKGLLGILAPIALMSMFRRRGGYGMGMGGLGGGLLGSLLGGGFGRRPGYGGLGSIFGMFAGNRGYGGMGSVLGSLFGRRRW